MKNLETHYTVLFARLLLSNIKSKKIVGITATDIMLLNHVMRNPVTEYDTVKLIDQAMCKYIDVFKSYNIPFKSLTDINSKKTGGKPVFNKISIYIDLHKNLLELRLPWLTREKFEPLIKFLKESLGMQFENRKDQDPVWFVLVREERVYELLLNNQMVKDIGYEVDADNIKKSIEKLNIDKENQKKLFKLSTTANLGAELNEFTNSFNKLYPFQKVAVEYSKHKHAILIADEMGLGKSVQALSIIEHHNLYPAVIIVPAMLRKNWKTEIAKWLPNKSVSVVESQKIVSPGDIYVISYSMISRMGDNVFIQSPKSVVCDESHFLKNPKSIRTEYVIKFFKNVTFKILTTGTPILNRTIELIPQLDLLGVLDTHFGGKRKFTNRYAPPQWNGYGTVYGSANEEELQVELRKSCMIRRLKKDVLSELPDKIKQVVTLPLSDREAYKKVERDSINWYKTKLQKQKLTNAEISTKVNEKLNARNEFAEKMVRVEYLRQAAVTYKMDAVFEWVDNTLDQVNKIVLFAHHRDIIDQLYEKYKNVSVKLYGGMSGDSKEIVDKFIKDDTIKLFIGSLSSAGVGIDGLQNVCDTIAFVELPWTPASLTQAEDRLHRIGQKGVVNIYYLISENTIEEFVYQVIVDKAEIFEKTTNINDVFKWIMKKQKK